MQKLDNSIVIAIFSLFTWTAAYADMTQENNQPMRDPFCPQQKQVLSGEGAASADQGQPLLRGIFFSEDPVALLEFSGSESILSAGETIGGFEIKEIKENEVIISDGKRTFILQLYEEESQGQQEPEKEADQREQP